MSGEGNNDVGQRVGPREERIPERDREQQRGAAGRSVPRRTAEREREPEEREDPEQYADPICVCEPEPYWQEVAEQLEREKEKERDGQRR